MRVVSLAVRLATMTGATPNVERSRTLVGATAVSNVELAPPGPVKG